MLSLSLAAQRSNEVFIDEEASEVLHAEFVDVGGGAPIEGKHALIIGHLAAEINEILRTVCHRVRILHQRIDLKADLEAF